MLTACGLSGSESEFPDKVRDQQYRYGSLVSDEGGFTLLGEDAKDESTGLTVNAYLWRATLDTVSFMPIASADPFGGVILTDWYSAPEHPEERLKLNVFILSRELRADGVRVKTFKQVQGESGNWADTDVAASVGAQLEETILTRARQMRMAQKDK
ncbi:MAG: DUF3576 domain-containing protein [Alphaproteobacteria bacterium]|nr:DUF3576 domain-containing protein [Alphaproteobacteria bacterium]